MPFQKRNLSFSARGMCLFAVYHAWIYAPGFSCACLRDEKYVDLEISSCFSSYINIWNSRSLQPDRANNTLEYMNLIIHGDAKCSWIPISNSTRASRATKPKHNNKLWQIWITRAHLDIICFLKQSSQFFYRAFWNEDRNSLTRKLDFTKFFLRILPSVLKNVFVQCLGFE